MAKKGSASGILAFVLLIILIGVVFLSLDITTQNGLTINRKIDLQQDFYVMSNALESAKLYLDIAIKYSTYQAIFDYGKEEKTDSNAGNFEAVLSDRIKQNLNRYTQDKYSFLTPDYKVTLPKYDNINLLIENNAIKASAASRTNLIIQKEVASEKSRLEKSGNLEFIFDYPSIKYINILAEHNLRDKLINYINTGWKLSGNKMLTGCENKNREIEDLEVFNHISSSIYASWPDASKSFSVSIQSEILSIRPDSTENLDLNLSVSNVTATIDHICKTKKDDKCDQTEKTFLYVKNCDFKYNFAGNVSLSITDKNKQYPVKVMEEETEKILFTNMTFISTNSLSLDYP